MDKVTNEIHRELYEPPAIEDIPLHAEEQMLAGCKQPNGPSAISSVCLPQQAGGCATPNPS